MEQLEPLPNTAFDERIDAILSEYQYRCTEQASTKFEAFKQNVYDHLPVNLPEGLCFEWSTIEFYLNNRTLTAEDIRSLARSAAPDLHYSPLLRDEHFREKVRLLQPLITMAPELTVRRGIRDLLLLYARQSYPSFDELVSIIDRSGEISLRWHAIQVEKDNELGYQLLEYYRQQDGWEQMLEVIYFPVLMRTPDTVLREKYKSVYLAELRAADCQGKFWFCDCFGLLEHFTREEILALCEEKIELLLTRTTTIEDTECTYTDSDRYLKAMGIPIALYFPMDQIMTWIDHSENMLVKAVFIWQLVQRRSDFSPTQKKILINCITSSPRETFKHDLAWAMIDTLRRLIPEITDTEIMSHVHYTEAPHYPKMIIPVKHNLLSFIKIADELSTFYKPLNNTGAPLPHNYNYLHSWKTTGNELPISFLKERQLSFSLPHFDESTLGFSPDFPWPIAYEKEISTAINGLLTDRNIHIEIVADFKIIPDRRCHCGTTPCSCDSSEDVYYPTIYTLYAWCQGKLHSVSITQEDNKPETEAIYALLNKVLMDCHIPERLVNYWGDREVDTTVILAAPSNLIALKDRL